ncbi:MAG: anthranilate synthase component II [Peptococcaceae bacterium]
MLLVMDNYDSFVYNLVQYLGILGEKVEVVRNDRIQLRNIEKLNPERIVISPGPGRPEDAGICLELIKKFAGRIPILGVCLGHQCIGLAYGGQVVRAQEIVHGKTSRIAHSGQGIFAGVPQDISVTRYHSLVVKKSTLPADLQVTAEGPDGMVMALEHTRYPVYGVQFHPESIAGQYGLEILQNFLKI